MTRALTFLLLVAATRDCCSAASAAHNRVLRNRTSLVHEDEDPANGGVGRMRKYYKVKPRRESPEQLLAIAKQHAIQVIIEKMYRALGSDFPKEPNMTIPIGEVLPTVANVSSIVADPCPYIYTKCSSESFLPSCSPPNNSNPIIWKKMYNLYFPIPEDMFDADTLLNASLQLYKANTLPIDEPTLMVVELYAYTGNVTKRREFITSTNVTSDYIGWISMDVTDLIENLRSDSNHGFHIKVKEYTGIYWNDLSTFTAMDCTNDTNFIALPLGVRTDQPESKFPSLNIRTGTPEQIYPQLPSDDDPLTYYNDYNYDNGHYTDEDEFKPTMYGDDPNVSQNPVTESIHRPTETFNLPPTNFIALPLGGRTDQPESKFPSLNVRTGTPEQNYPQLPIDEDPLTYYNDYSYGNGLYIDEDEFKPMMYGDDPNVSKNPVTESTYRPTETFNLPSIHLPPKQVSAPMLITEPSTNVHLNLVEEDSDPSLKHDSDEEDDSGRGWYGKWWPYNKRASPKKTNRRRKHKKQNKKGNKNEYHSLLL